MFIARAVCGLTHVTVASLCCSCSLLCISNSDWATENEAGRSVSVNGDVEPRWRDLSPIQCSCNCNYSLITHNKTPVHLTCGYWEWVRPVRLPVLTWVPSSIPLGTIFKIRSPPGPRRIQQRYNWHRMSSTLVSVRQYFRLSVLRISHYCRTLTDVWRIKFLYCGLMRSVITKINCC